VSVIILPSKYNNVSYATVTLLCRPTSVLPASASPQLPFPPSLPLAHILGRRLGFEVESFGRMHGVGGHHRRRNTMAEAVTAAEAAGVTTDGAGCGASSNFAADADGGVLVVLADVENRRRNTMAEAVIAAEAAGVTTDGTGCGASSNFAADADRGVSLIAANHDGEVSFFER
ncbi:MAG: hypothetical protein LQ352_008203, partial [Teloschistes flavicans]